MKTTAAVLLLALIAVAMVAVNAEANNAKHFYRSEFVAWQKQHKKMYGTSDEFNKRLAVFTQNYQEIQTINNEKRTWTAGLNAYSDLTWEEFKAHFNLAPQECSATKGPKAVQPEVALPPSFDWRYFGVINPVKNQGHCGSCWAFSATAAQESHWAIKTGKLFSLAEQQLVDCAPAPSHGCSGGLPSYAFEYFSSVGGQTTEDQYPYTAQDGSCKFQQSKAVVFTKGSYNITEGDEADIATQIVKSGTVSVAYQVVADFRHYKAGVYSSTTCKSDSQSVNHAVLAVGYNVTSLGDPYWIIRNSWGEDWGMGGYFWMAKYKDPSQPLNMCGIATCASYPLM